MANKNNSNNNIDKYTFTIINNINARYIITLTNNINKLGKKLSVVDKSITDIEHDLELSKLNAIELMQDTVRLRKILRRRRAIKNAICYLHALKNNIESTQQHYIELDLSYKPRVLTDLKIAQKNVCKEKFHKNSN